MNGIDNLTEDPARWADLFADAPGSALEQSFIFGEALAATASVKVERFAVESDGKPVALVQAFRRQLFGGLTLVRVVRGPIWLSEAGNGAVEAVFQALRARWSRRRGQILSLVPELPDTEESDALLRRCGFRRMATGYSTVLIDLSPPLETLRSSLYGKWRNALVKAEGGDLRVGVSAGGDILHDLASRYDAFRKARRFSGPEGALVRALGREKGGVTVLSAHRADRVVSGIAVARHGNSATYYISWTGDEGREANAHNLLLWRAVELLKADGVKQFDLGGVDAVHAPGVARFKLGLGSPPITFAGSYL